ncbi:MAG TPA: FAD-dependent monooxygenase [Mucilaginibacter sp.]|nr:FAD-dependent monooxygenase [Mucilaginibacter sp.]
MEPVIIIGGGPAGAAAAITLSSSGIPNVVLDADKNSFKPGESLPPNAAAALINLGIEKRINRWGSSPYHGINTYWGSTAGQYRHFFAEPHAAGWHLNRTCFEAGLRDMATQCGTQWLKGWSFDGIRENSGKITVNAAAGHGQMKSITASFVIDCSGRASLVSKSQGGRRNILDRLIAFYAMIEGLPTFVKSTTFVESVSDGWWYAAPGGKNSTMVYFMTDSDLYDIAAHDKALWFHEHLSGTCHLVKKIPGIVESTISSVGISTATTSVTNKPYGGGWIAAGDALFTLDPLTSFGITAALNGGYHAAKAVAATLNGDQGAVSTYLQNMQDTFNLSLEMLQNQYRLEQRWPNERFWSRRH